MTTCIGCGHRSVDPPYDYCPTCWLRLRDLVEEAAREIVAAAEALLREMTR